MRYEGEKAMKSVILTAVMALLLGVSCANSEQSVFLEKFIPWSAAEQCKVSPDSKLWYDTGYIDIYFTDEYWLPFKMINEMGVSQTMGSGVEEAPIDSQEANDWVLRRIILDYELPPIPGIVDGAWDRREVVSEVKVDTNGGMISGFVQILTRQQHANLVDIFALFATNAVLWDWETYPIIVSVQGEGEKQGGGDTIRTNKLHFRLVPQYGETVRAGAVYPDGNWPTDDEIETANPLPADQEQKKYERDKEIYDTMMAFCDFATEHLSGCAPGQDFGLVDCWTAMGYYDAIEALFPSQNCCPEEAPEAPQAPSSGN